MQTTRLTASLVLLSAATLSCAWPDVSGSWSEPPPPAPIGDPPPEEEGDGPLCPSVGGIVYDQPRPNVMLLVDRSGSMAEPGACAEGTCPSKWQQLLALGGYLEDVKRHARLGLTVFPAPGNDGCSVASGTLIPLSDAPDVDDQILGAVASLAPGGRTPIAAALDELAARGGLDDPDRENVVVLLTDGQPNCVCSSTDPACEQAEAVAAVERLAQRGVKIKLDVVGFGSSATAATETLSAMAIAAGTDIPGPVPYYRAESVEDLIGRLYQIAAGLAPCRFNLDETPSPEQLVVHLDDSTVERCTTTPCSSGYSYDQANGVVNLHGDTCQAIRDGACHSVWFETVAAP